MSFEAGILAILTLLFAGFMWFVRDAKSSNDRNHTAHFTHASSTALHETERERTAVRLSTQNNINEVARELERHASHDDTRFDKIENKMDGIADDIKDVLKMLNEKAPRG